MYSRANLLKTLCRNVVSKRNVNDLFHEKAYINGEWVVGANKEMFPVMNPYDGSVVGCVPDLTTRELDTAIHCAHDAFQEWQDTTGKDRSMILRRWYDLMVKHTPEIAHIMTLESGKSFKEASLECNYGNSYVEWFAEEAKRINGEIVNTPQKTKQIMLKKFPIGVASLITPWNFPHAMIARKAGAALAAGCTVVIKPSEETPLTALAMAKLAHEAGIPKGVYNVVTTHKKHSIDIGKMMCQHPKVAGISFTGSTEVGKKLFEQAAVGIKRLSLELGGNAPFIVFESANVDLAVEGAMASKFRNSGQTCIASNRFMVHQKVYDEFVRKLKDKMEHLKMGNGMEPDTMVGPLITQMQLDKVSAFVKDAIDKGAHVITGGKAAKKVGPLFFEPTLLSHVTEKMSCVREEVFGPVASVMPFTEEEEAIRIANNTTRGLAGYFYSNDIAQIFRVVRHLEVGMIGVNEGMISMAEAAFGGIKESGVGREGSHHGVDDYLYIKYLCVGNLRTD